MKLLTKTFIFAAMLVADAEATQITNGFGLGAPTSTIFFNEVALVDGTVVTNQYSAFGATFSPSLTFDTSYSGSFPNVSGGELRNFFPPNSSYTTPFSIFFTQDQTDAAFALVTNTGTSIFSAYNNGNLVETFAASTGYSGTFYGFTGIVFDEIRVDTTNTQNAAMLLDNLQMGAPASSVPDGGSTIAMLGLALTAVAGARRKFGI